MASAELPKLQDLVDLGKKAVSPEAPAGADASYDPDFEKLQREIDKLSLVTAVGESTDWTLVASLGAGLLAGKSKDMKIASYLAEALTKTAQLDGLACGVHILRDMVQTYWQDLFPPLKRMRGRINAVAWWSGRARAFLESFEPAPLPALAVAALKDDLEALDKTLAEKSDDAPSLRPLIEIVGRFPIQTPPSEAAPPAQADETQGAPPGPGAPSEAAAAPPPRPTDTATSAQSLDQAKGQLAAGLDLLFSASYALLTADLQSPLPYRLARLAAWLPLAAPPPATNGKTMIPPPPSAVRAALEQPLASGNFAAAIGNAESHMREYRFWLDLSRVSADGLRGLGLGHEAALDTLESETALFVRRFPGIADLAFSDGTPFASEKTKLWLSHLASLGKPASPAGDGSGGGVGDGEVDAVLDQARGLAATGKTIDAVKLMQGKLSTITSGRLRLRCRIGLAEILAASGTPEAARPIAEQILGELDAHKLDDFDPEMALSGLLLVRRTLASAKDEAGKAWAAEALSRIMRLNPSEGLRLLGG